MDPNKENSTPTGIIAKTSIEDIPISQPFNVLKLLPAIFLASFLLLLLLIFNTSQIFFLAGVLILISLVIILERFRLNMPLTSLLIIVAILGLNIIPVPRNAIRFQPEFHESTEPKSIGLGFPGAYYKIY